MSCSEDLLSVLGAPSAWAFCAAESSHAGRCRLDSRPPFTLTGRPVATISRGSEVAGAVVAFVEGRGSGNCELPASSAASFSLFSCGLPARPSGRANAGLFDVVGAGPDEVDSVGLIDLTGVAAGDGFALASLAGVIALAGLTARPFGLASTLELPRSLKAPTRFKLGVFLPAAALQPSSRRELARSCRLVEASDFEEWELAAALAGPGPDLGCRVDG